MSLEQSPEAHTRMNIYQSNESADEFQTPFSQVIGVNSIMQTETKDNKGGNERHEK
jgi:hypothetical protein